MKKLGSFLLGLLIATGSVVLGQVPISGLPPAIVPLTGNEAVVLVQKNGCSLPNGCTRQAPVSVVGATATPAGANTQVQFNNLGAFGANSNFTYNAGSDVLNLGGPLIPGTFSIGSLDAMTISGVALAVPGFAINSNTQGNIESHSFSSTPAAGATSYGVRARGTISLPTTAVNGDNLLTLAGAGFDGTNYTWGAHIHFLVDGVPSAGVLPGALDFQTTPAASNTPVSVLKLDHFGAYTVNGSLGTSGQVLATQGAGLPAHWIPAIAPGGVTGNVQYNNAGAFAGTNDFTWDPLNLILAMGNSAVGGPIITAVGPTATQGLSLNLQGGASTSGGVGGPVLIFGGGGTNQTGGAVTFSGGAGTGTNPGGQALIQGGHAANATGGAVNVSTFAGGTSGNASGTISIGTGTATGTGNSGLASITTGGTAAGTVGNINITTGVSTGGGISGSIAITASHNVGGTDGNITLAAHGATVETLGAGSQIGAPTGGDCGVGCLNAQALRINNVAVGAGTVTSISAGTGITLTPNPIVATGSAAVDQTFTPTWTGKHLWSQTSATFADLTAFCNFNLATGSRCWTDTVTGTTVGTTQNSFGIAAASDAGVSGGVGPAVSGSAISFRRVAGSTAISIENFGNSVDNPTFNFQGTGSVGIGQGTFGPGAGAAIPLNFSGPAGFYAALITGNATVGSSLGLRINAGTNASDVAFSVNSQVGTNPYFYVDGDGGVVMGAPTGGDCGVACLNAGSDVRVNNVSLCQSTGTNCPLTQTTGTATLTYVSGCTTGTATASYAYSKIGNIVSLKNTGNTQCTAAAGTTITLTGLPVAIQPATSSTSTFVYVTSGSANQAGIIGVTTGSANVTYNTVGAAFTGVAGPASAGFTYTAQ